MRPALDQHHDPLGWMYAYTCTAHAHLQLLADASSKVSPRVCRHYWRTHLECLQLCRVRILLGVRSVHRAVW